MHLMTPKGWLVVLCWNWTSSITCDNPSRASLKIVFAFEYVAKSSILFGEIARISEMEEMLGLGCSAVAAGRHH